MNAGPSRKAEELFHAALDRDRAERAAFLAEACGCDTALRKEVESLLAAREKSYDFPESSALAVLARQSPGEWSDLAAFDKNLILPFDRLGEFRIIRRLGEGGMGFVYLAVQESLGREVALKVIRPEHIGSAEAETRFRREVDAVSRLRHSNIVTVFGSGVEQGVHYFAMELVPGKGLDEILRDESSSRADGSSSRADGSSSRADGSSSRADGSSSRADGSSHRTIPPLSKVLSWIRDIALALDSAHQAGIIHRDVKPSNIRITPEGRAMLLDFGVARHSRLSTMTLTGEFRGTPHYASPEQVRAASRKIDARTDIYSLGVALYEAVAGSIPFEGETTEQVFRKILEDEPVPPRRLNAGLPRDLETVIMKALEKDPERRYAAMADFAADLQRLRAGEPVVAKPAGFIRKAGLWIRRHRFSTLAVVSFLLLAAAVVIPLLLLTRQRDQESQEARVRFKELTEALEWEDLPLRAPARKWFRKIDPGDPAGPMLDALSAIEENYLNKAVGFLEECKTKSRDRAERSLEGDACYLLALVHLTMADDSSVTPEEEQVLRRKARNAMNAVGEFDLLSPDAFLLREGDPASILTENSKPSIQKISLNEEHYLVHLYLGVFASYGLFRSGEIGEFGTAISHLEDVLKHRPNNVIALLCLGRTYYFFARYYDYFHLIETAENWLNHARQEAGKDPYYMIDNTLGAIRLLVGDNDSAMKYNKKALEAAKTQDPGDIHNILGGIGKIKARQGRFDEARVMYEEALKSSLDDPHIHAVLAELSLMQRDTVTAAKWVDRLVELRAGRLSYKKKGALLASIYLLGARIYLVRGDFAGAEMSLRELYDFAIHAPRDFGQACLLLATFPEDQLRPDLVVLADSLTRKAYELRKPGYKFPPIYFSTLGVNHYLSGRYADAVSEFRAAIDARRDWPDEAREYYWTDDVRDQYLLAMTHHKLAADSSSGKNHAQRAREYFDKAESAFLKKTPPLEVADIIERFRAKAHEVLR